MVAVDTTRTITKVLIANRGEIAVRIIRGARDAGLESVAIYADADSASLFVEMADEAFALNGATPAETYLDIDKIIAIAKRSGADAVHPGYGFLSENSNFAQAVVDAGMVWIGPPPAAIESLGDKVTARHIAQKVGAPQVPGTTDPVKNADEIIEFAKTHGLPIAIKAAFGGGGRGLKVARTLEEIPAKFESATREAITAFGRGECFVERYLDRPRHVETQCLADEYGNVVVVSSRDCSLQRRHQKLVEEAPAPFLSDDQLDQLYSSSKAILKEAGYVSAATCEFLVGLDGTISFLEVNTRLQVEHPVTEQVSGVDLVREQFRIACGGHLDYPDPRLEGHSFEFRINAEDPGRNFMPAPGTLTKFQPPCGSGVRMDEGYHAGMSVPGALTHSSRSWWSTAPTALRPWNVRGVRSTSWSWRACPPWCPSTGPWCAIRPSPPRTASSPCSPTGSKPNSTTTSSPTPAIWAWPRSRLSARASWWRSMAAASR